MELGQMARFHCWVWSWIPALAIMGNWKELTWELGTGQRYVLSWPPFNKPHRPSTKLL